jgi:kynurenine formamidase
MASRASYSTPTAHAGTESVERRADDAPVHPHVAIPLSNVGVAGRQLGERDTAQPTQQHTLAINEAVRILLFARQRRCHPGGMSVLDALVSALGEGQIDVIDLTTPLSEDTPVIDLPLELGQPWRFGRELISRYDDAGPVFYWNNIWLCEHTGTHFDAPVHWLPGRDLDDVSQVPPRRLVGPAAVLDFSAQAAADPDFLLERDHVEAWQEEHGALPRDGWLLYRTGWDTRVGEQEFLNGGHTPGVAPECARWLAEQTPVVGIGVETVGTDAGLAGAFEDRPYPCHWYFQGAGKYGLTQLKNLAVLPSQGALVIASPLPIVAGSGSPARVLALVERA